LRILKTLRNSWQNTTNRSRCLPGFFYEKGERVKTVVHFVGVFFLAGLIGSFLTDPADAKSYFSFYGSASSIRVVTGDVGDESETFDYDEIRGCGCGGGVEYRANNGWLAWFAEHVAGENINTTVIGLRIMHPDIIGFGSVSENSFYRTTTLSSARASGINTVGPFTILNYGVGLTANSGNYFKRYHASYSALRQPKPEDGMAAVSTFGLYASVSLFELRTAHLTATLFDLGMTMGIGNNAVSGATIMGAKLGYTF